MSLIVSRSLTYLTLFMYLAVGTMAARFIFPEKASLRINTQYLSVFSNTKISSVELSPVESPELAFREIQFPLESTPVVVEFKKVVQAVQKKAPVVTKVAVSYELPFFEPVKVEPIYFEGLLLNNLLALYKDLEVETKTFIAEFEKTAVPVAPDAPAAKEIKDEVSTVAAKTQSNNVEPEFFDYPTEEAPAATAEVASSPAPVVSENAAEPAFFEYPTEVTAAAAPATSAKTSTAPILANAMTITGAPASSAQTAEEVNVDSMLWDYSALKKDVAQNKVPTVTVAKSDKVEKSGIEPLIAGDEAQEEKSTKSVPKSKKIIVENQAQVNIQATGSDLKNTQGLVGFEVRFQDDQNEILEDHNNGEVVLKANLNQSQMTRSLVMLKRGFAPTNTEIIVEKGVASVSLPLIEEETFNEMMAPYESKGAVGAVLVELDDETEVAEIDMPFAKMIYLDGDLKKTSGGDYRYQLFVGVKAGNAFLSYKDAKGQAVSKIIHVHEREVTFEANYFEKVQNNVVKLYEEDLLSKDKAPLIISSEQVKQFATDKTAKKINDHTYKVNFGQGLLGGRQYLELNHLEEPTFVGFRDNSAINVPSENFMRFILSRFENSKLGNRCLIQVNLTKKADRLDVNAESVDSSVVTFTQMLDSDGKFYDSIGEKTRKIIIVGENQGSPDTDQNAKINLKIEFQDGTTQYLGSYCSPNSYLVEQL